MVPNSGGGETFLNIAAFINVGMLARVCLFTCCLCESILECVNVCMSFNVQGIRRLKASVCVCRYSLQQISAIFWNQSLYGECKEKRSADHPCSTVVVDLGLFGM